VPISHLYGEALASERYFDPYFKLDAVKILPGEYYVTARPMLIVTVLGSCVSACIRDRISGIGGMNHFMLPEAGDGGDVVNASARYGTYAMEVLINQLLKMGARRANLEAKVFGGGNVLQNHGVANIGDRNARFVHLYLNAENIKIVAEDLLDIYPRKVYFFPETGKVMVKKLKKLNNDTIFQREREYDARLRSERVSGAVDLF
jgi:chemotaxis protein CheD